MAHFIIIPSAQETKGKGKIAAVVVEGTTNSSNTPHHRVQTFFKIFMAALNIELSVSVVRSGDIMIISAQNPCDMRHQITQDKIWHKLTGVSHKAVVEVQ